MKERKSEIRMRMQRAGRAHAAEQAQTEQYTYYSQQPCDFCSLPKLDSKHTSQF